MIVNKLKRPLLIAEISSNHNGKIDNAIKLIYLAKKYGADAVKLQTFTPETMTLNSKKKYFKIKSGLWKGYTLWDLYTKAQTPLSWHNKLFSIAKKINIKIFSTPFDESAVDFLETLRCPFYKISSFEMCDESLIKRVARTKKPIIISTGLSDLKEIERSYKTAKNYGAKSIALLYCVSNYPAEVEDFNLNNISILKKRFNCPIGFSDHSRDSEIAQIAISKGAQIVEKHIALENQKTGFDINFSLRGKEIKLFREKIDKAYLLTKKDTFFRNKTELKNKKFRRSIFSIADIKRGVKFSKENIKRVRPGNGISPRFYQLILNKKSPINISKYEPLKEIIIKKLNLKK